MVRADPWPSGPSNPAAQQRGGRGRYPAIPLESAAASQKTTQRTRGRSRRGYLLTAVSLLVISLLAFLHPTLAQRIAPATSRSYPRYSTTQLSVIPDLADAAKSLDHHDPSSFVSQILIPRVAGSEGIKKVAQTILDVFQKELGADNAKGRSGWDFEDHVFEDQTPYGLKPFRNLVFTKNPKASRRLVLACHHDSKYFEKGDFLGATDSAAPCAMMVDVARSLDSALEKKMGEEEDLTLQFMFLDGEEAFKAWTHTDSTYGSRALASLWSETFHQPRRLMSSSTPSRKIDTIDHFVLLDLLGAANPSIPSYFSSTEWLFNEMVSSEGRLRDANLLWPAKLMPSFDFTKKKSFFRLGVPSYGIEDDHLPFLANGVPILHIIPSPFPRVWHTLKDDASALDYPTNYAWAMLLRLFTAEYLQLDLGGSSKRASNTDTNAERREAEDTTPAAAAAAAAAEDGEEEEGWADEDWLHEARKARNGRRGRTELASVPSVSLLGVL